MLGKFVDDPTSEILWAKDIATARIALNRALTAADVQFYVYGNFRPGLEQPYYDTTYPVAWIERYLGQCYQAIDPVVHEARRNHLPFAWRYILNRAGGLTEIQQRMFAEAAELGIRDGYSIPFHDHSGCIAVMSFAFDSTERMTDVLTRHPNLRLLGAYYHAAIERLLEIETDEDTLSAVERQCLHWAAAGRSLWEISAVTHRPEGDVASALRTARHKLGATSTAHAHEIAVELGLIGAL